MSEILSHGFWCEKTTGGWNFSLKEALLWIMYWWFVFISCLDFHSDSTHSQRIHWRTSDLPKSVLKKKQTLHLGWSELQKLHFWVNGSFKVGTWAILRDQNILESWVLEPQSKFFHSNVLASTHNSNVFYKAQRIQFPLQGKHKCTCSVWRRVCDLCNKCNV